jgi:23S rRNA-/tRNA-specific pseudouridylate synthase
MSIVSFLLLLFLTPFTLSFQLKLLLKSDFTRIYGIRRRRGSRNYIDKVVFSPKRERNSLHDFSSSQLPLARRPDISKIQQMVEAEEKKEKEEVLNQQQVKKVEEETVTLHGKTDFIKILVPSQYDNTRVDLVLDKLLPQYLHNNQQSYQYDDDDDDEEFTFSSWDNIPNVQLSRTQIASLIQERDVYISFNRNNNTNFGEEEEERGTITQKSFLVSTGQILWIPRTAIIKKMYHDANPLSIVPENITLSILYEDEYMIVVNKQAGLVVHPAVGNWNGTLVNALAFYLMNQSSYGPGELFEQDSKTHQDGRQLITEVSNRPGIVHRLDKGTSGVIIVAKTTAALQALSEMFARRKVKKTVGIIYSFFALYTCLLLQLSGFRLFL